MVAYRSIQHTCAYKGECDQALPCSNGAIHSARVGISLSGFPLPLRRWEQRIAWRDESLKPYHC